MRSDRSIPGEPWPYDMVLTITNDSDALLQMLWIRQSLDLRPPGDDWPPLIPDLAVENPDGTEGAGPARPGLAESWGRIWRAATEHAGNRPSPDLLEDARTASTPDRRAEILTAFQGPSWLDEHDDEGFGDAYRTWREDLLRALIVEQHLALELTPERRSLPALVTIPAPGAYIRTIGRHGLLTTAETRADPARYTDALHAFDPQ